MKAICWKRKYFLKFLFLSLFIYLFIFIIPKLFSVMSKSSGGAGSKWLSSRFFPKVKGADRQKNYVMKNL